jgi:hypothetical protein
LLYTPEERILQVLEGQNWLFGGCYFHGICRTPPPLSL